MRTADLVDSKPQTPPHRRHFSLAPLVSLVIIKYVSTFFSFLSSSIEKKGDRSVERITLRDCETLIDLLSVPLPNAPVQTPSQTLLVTGLALSRDPDSWVLGILEERKAAEC